MTRVEWKRWKKEKNPLISWKPYNVARKHFPLCKLGRNIVLHHKNLNCTNYEEWNIDELVPMFCWCHNKFHSQSAESNKKRSEALKGRVNGMLDKTHSKETRAKISEMNKGRGLGNKQSEETLNKLSIIRKGKIPWNKGIKMPDNFRKKVSVAKKGKPSPKRGIPLSQEQKIKISETKKKKRYGA
jgi:hypothetical protein